jgi:hypothetical protein
MAVMIVHTTPVDADAAWLHALLTRDVAGADAVLHDEYALVLVHPQPTRVERAEWLRVLPGYVVGQWVDEQSAWDIRGDLAVHLRLVRMRATVFGVDRSGLFTISDTWLRTPDGWRVWIRHSTPQTAGGLPHGPAVG